MTKKIAIVLAGCGVMDGSEIHEAVLTLLAIDKHGAIYQCFAPDIPQAQVINHITGEEMQGETRNVLIESARICRGKIMPLSEYMPQDYDALIFPGGFGAAKNLFTFALDGPDFTIDPDVKRAVLETRQHNKPIGALCISPVLLAKLVEGVTVTIGSDKSVAAAIKGPLKARHTVTNHGELTIDEKHNIVTTPCYMLNASISQIAQGTDNLVREILNRA
ncbi:MAG: isoprenoid biosynthesis glyoxalase ElbB [Alphaproteobacteria bacterium]|nr:isoprenoid biosynthesis glyoxalase ElbB [Alphaproteobacteria bacterium]